MGKILDAIAVSRGLSEIIKPLTQVEVRLSAFIGKVNEKVDLLQETIDSLENDKKEKLKERNQATKIKEKIDNFFQ